MLVSGSEQVCARASYDLKSEAEWKALRAAHETRVRVWTEPHRARHQRGEKHPVHDFLFDYYSFRPAHLERWSPGPGVVLEKALRTEFPESWPMEETEKGWWLNPAHVPSERRQGFAWTLNLLQQTAQRPAQTGCYGLHEWAMVYRAPEVRHAAHPLRLPPDQLAAFVETQPLLCSHFDAFRFFTPEARPLNRWQPARETQPELEQPGCLHANMDLYKWAYKAHPWISSELVADCFALAIKIRELDMRASPYDLAALGFPPVKIETEEGRREYANAQAGFAFEAAPLRERLINAYRGLLGEGITKF